jgi:hypothetical protein
MTTSQLSPPPLSEETLNSLNSQIRTAVPPPPAPSNEVPSAPGVPAFADLTASVLWCAACRHAHPVRLQDETYHCAICGAEVGPKTTTAEEIPPAAPRADEFDEGVIA